jgi:spore coat protein U-like protein
MHLRKINTKLISALAVSVACLAPMTQSHAAISGQVKARLNVSSGCQVNSNISGSANDFGTLDFHNTGPVWPNVLTAELATTGGGALQVTCDKDVGSFSVSFDGGLGGSRELVGPSPEDRIAYELYQDAGRTQTFAANTAVSYSVASGTPVSVPVYGAIAANPTTAKSKGVYSDTLMVTVDF